MAESCTADINSKVWFLVIFKIFILSGGFAYLKYTKKRDKEKEE
jgi:hypothetical protein